MPQNTKMLIGAIIAAVLAIAVYYGAISQQTASNIQGQADKSLGTGPAAQQPAPAPQQPAPAPQQTPAPPPTAPASPAPGQPPR